MRRQIGIGKDRLRDQSHRLAICLRPFTLVVALTFFACITTGTAEANEPLAATPTMPITGVSVPELKALDQALTALMAKHALLAGQVAVSKNGRLVYNRGFGFADKERKVPVQPTHLFRIASVTKPITAVAIMGLFQEGKLKLDDKAFTLLKNLKPAPGAKIDKRLNQITVRNLLEHSGGWTWNHGDQQQIYLRAAADAFRERRPASAVAIIRYTMGQPLDFDPGTRSVYSNFGYNVLGRIIETLTGKSYGQYIKQKVLAPAGIKDMELGHTRPKDQRPNEVHYDDGADASTGWSVFEDEQFGVTNSYGADYSLEAFDAHGGWLATAEDLVKFLCAVDGRGPRQQLLKPETIKIMTERPTISQDKDKPTYYAKGWNVDPDKGIWTHAGALAYGTSSVIYRLPDGVNIAAVFNHLPKDLEAYFKELGEETVIKTIGNVRSWPTTDLFTR